MVNREESLMTDPEQYLLPADINLIRCVDERQATDATNGVEIPGGIYGIIDAVKVLANVSEDEAWRMVRVAGIPFGAHVDDHHGARGCGYANKVENDPQAVLAPEKVVAQERLDRVRQANGVVMHYLGEHHATHATINFREGFSFDPDKASEHGLGVFNCDAWAVGEYAQRLGMNPNVMEEHMIRIYKATVTALTGITSFNHIR